VLVVLPVVLRNTDRTLESGLIEQAPWTSNCFIDHMATEVPKADIPDICSRYQVHYEVRPYYVVWAHCPENAPHTEQTIQAGFTVDLYAALEKCEVPFFDTEDARVAVDYFDSLAHKIQAEAGNNCRVEVIPQEGSLVMDTHEHFQPEAMLQIRISHDRGLDQPAGGSEETALKTMREALHELGVRES